MPGLNKDDLKMEIWKKFDVIGLNMEANYLESFEVPESLYNPKLFNMTKRDYQITRTEGPQIAIGEPNWVGALVVLPDQKTEK